MANESKKLTKKEKKRLFWTRLACIALAALMVGGVVYSALIFFV